eukprot:15362315-Alexandrium_andersonii.AAC.1
MQLDLGRQPKVTAHTLQAGAFASGHDRTNELGIAGAQRDGLPVFRPMPDQVSTPECAVT